MELLMTEFFEKSPMAYSYNEIIVDHDNKNKHEDYIFIKVNPAFEDMFGRKESDIMNKSINEVLSSFILDSNEIDRYQKVIQSTIIGCQKTDTNVYLKSLQKYIQMSIVPVSETHFACIYNDITNTIFHSNRLTKMKAQEKENLYQKVLLENSKLLGMIMDNAPIGIWMTNEKSDTIFTNHFFDENFNMTQEDYLGCVLTNLDTLNKEGTQYYDEVVTFKDNKKHTIETIKTKVRDNDGTVQGVLGLGVDITERKETENALNESEAKFRAISESAIDAVIMMDQEGKVMYWSPSAERIFGYTKDEIIGRMVHGVLMPEKYQEQFKNGYTVFEHSGQGPLVGKLIELTAIHKCGREFPIEVALSSVYLQKQHMSTAIIRDITVRKEAENIIQERQRQIEFLNHHDYLTGLYNRMYMEKITKEIDDSNNIPFAYMIFDINGLKLTNDAFGHEMGDKLIITVAEILMDAFGQDGYVGRFGGDEFVAVLPGTDCEQADVIKKNILKAIAGTKMDSVIVSVAIGYAIKSSAEQDILDVLREADYMMYKDKLKHGKTMRSQTLETVLRNINNHYTSEQIHTERVSQYCESIARAMGFSECEVFDIKVAGSLHDVGKIMIPAELLNKKDKLSDKEKQIINRHPETGYQILKGVDEYSHLAEIVLYHHERWDGNGYPSGLKDTAIPIQSRIITVADAFEAMTAKRSYQKSKSKEEAITELKRCAGVQFDTQIVNVFIQKVL
ncbi:MAG: diguanylate cyclase and metal dependent phosphohydrolase [Anaerocolumna sp.]|nr:diguanylate cyclase and metal dependent phosphohydrolase [Anaerocolumna sp.]